MNTETKYKATNIGDFPRQVRINGRNITVLKGESFLTDYPPKGDYWKVAARETISTEILEDELPGGTEPKDLPEAELRSMVAEKCRVLGWRKFKSWAKDTHNVTDTSKNELIDEVVKKIKEGK